MGLIYLGVLAVPLILTVASGVRIVVRHIRTATTEPPPPPVPRESAVRRPLAPR